MEFTSFLDYLHLEKKYSNKTIIAYKNDLQTFCNFNLEKFEQTNIKKVNYSQIRSWIVSLVADEISNNTINRKISSLAGSSDTLEELGMNIQMNPEVARKSLEQFNFCFMLAPIYHPAMKNVMPVRQELGFRTVFNILGPLTNPACVKYQLVGVYEKSLAIKMIEVLRNLNTKRAWVVHGSDGTDEISITGDTHVVELDDGKINEFKINPKDAGLKTYDFAEILGGTSKFNAQKIEKLINGEMNGFFNSVLFNSAAALVISERVKNLEDGVRLSSDALLSGQTKELIEKLKESKTSKS